MDDPEMPAALQRFQLHVYHIGALLGDDARRASFATYAVGLISEGERKSMEPIACRACPELKEALRSERYQPQAVRRVLIPKASGVGERPLGIPTIRDRVVQTAAKLVLEPIFEADFDEASYGYRPGRSAVDAVQKVHQTLQRGHTEVVDAD